MCIASARTGHTFGSVERDVANSKARSQANEQNKFALNKLVDKLTTHTGVLFLLPPETASTTEVSGQEEVETRPVSRLAREKSHELHECGGNETAAHANGQKYAAPQ